MRNRTLAAALASAAVAALAITTPALAGETATEVTNRVADQTLTISSADGNERIKGGDLARQGDYPFITSLNGGCGAALISPDIVITAAHCIGSRNNRTYTGHVDWQQGTMRTSSRLVAGPGVGRADWAVLKLDQPITDAQPVDVTVDARFDSPDTFRSIGWGMTNEGGNQQRLLRQADIKHIPSSQCSSGNAATEICAGTAQTTACKGDSGSPLLSRDGNRWVLVGMTSWGNYDCARDGAPGHFARLSGMIDPVKQAIKDLGGVMPRAWDANAPAPVPTTTPTATPTSTPTAQPTTQPTPQPTATPTSKPTRPSWPWPWPWPWPQGEGAQ